ncbi:hypothetical protein JCM10908_005921 [Rhodotorula pacifica]|uniref:uncharacterized protein n=1 Tax=Rhodotorula pacifica TaxID=1495444 RepID=UPI0031720F45
MSAAVRTRTQAQQRHGAAATAAATSLRLSPRRRFVAFLLVTALLGTTFSILSVSPTTTAFRSRLPAHTLTQLTSKGRAFPVPSLPYFADKRNAINQLFVKRSWAWVTGLFLAFASAVVLLPAPRTASTLSAQSTSSSSPASNTRRAAASANRYGAAADSRSATSNPLTPHLIALTRRYLLASLYWFYLTQATWFGLRLGPSITHRILRSSGAVCVPSAIAHDPLAPHAAAGGLHHDGAGGKSMHLDGPNDARAGMVCTGAKGEYWRGGHDVSGHSFMMVHCSLFLFELVLPLLPTLFPALFVGPKIRTHPAVKAIAYAAVGMIALSWWMLLMTNLFFHSPTEKLSGFGFGLMGWYLSSL